jgi:hypothetical protein
MIVYCLSVHKNPEQVRRLLNSIYTSDDFFYINIFGADSKKEQAEWINYLKSFEKINVYFSFKYSHSWGTIDQVKANLDAMEYFANTDYSHFINLSGQCYPIKSIIAIKKTLLHKKCSFLAYNKMPDYCSYAKNKEIYCPPNTRFHFRFDYCYYPVPRWYLIQFLKGLFHIRKDVNIFFKIPRINKKLLFKFELYKGSNWFCLYKDHVNYILDFLKNNPEYSELFATVLCSDEHFFQTILLNSSHGSQIINENLRYIVWNESGTMPQILCSENIPEILGSGKLFARKFDIKNDSTILDLIDSNIRYNP